MFFKKKGQGALEYLLLIGGAVLIAVIVIALLVGMGGQSRETAQDQATKAQQALEQPQPATIVAIKTLSSTTTPSATNCLSGTSTAEGLGTVTVDWQQLGSGGVYTLKVYDYAGTALVVEIDGEATPTGKLPTTGTPTAEITLPIAAQCADTYWGEIETTKNGQTVKSTRMKFNW